jgi:hypothetical protein
MCPTPYVFQNKNKRARIFICFGISPTVLHVVAEVNNLAFVNGYWLLCIFSELFLLDSIIYLFLVYLEMLLVFQTTQCGLVNSDYWVVKWKVCARNWSQVDMM